MRNRLISLLLIILMTMSLISGCGQSKPAEKEQAKVETPAPKEEPRKVETPMPKEEPKETILGKG
ncbi:MAG: hypothetical protein ACOY9Y_04255 [Bacillota bacterium]